MQDHWSTTRLVDRRDWAEGLATFRFDAELPPFAAGQYVNVGLMVDGKRLKRAYSLASAPGRPPELFLRRVEGGTLTPRLFAMRPGDELLMERKPRGFFTLGEVGDAAVLWLVATGTGLGPYVSMLRTPEPWERYERIVVVHGVRYRSDLAYADELAERSRAHRGRLVVVPVVSRDPEAPDVLHGRIPAALADGRLEARAGVELRPEDAQVMLCGSPEMLEDMQRALEGRGLRRHRRRAPGNIHVERYW